LYLYGSSFDLFHDHSGALRPTTSTESSSAEARDGAAAVEQEEGCGVTNVSGRHLAVEHQMEACATGDEVIVSERARDSGNAP
jgi:hypothetical protein